MRYSLWLILLVLAMAGGCSRCEREEPDLCEGALGRMNLGVQLHQYIDTPFDLDNVNSLYLPKPTRYLMQIDTIYDTSMNVLIHGYPCDSVHWKIGSEARWRKGDNILIHFVRLNSVGEPLLISKRVWGQRAVGCNKVLDPYYETSRRFPTSRRWNWRMVLSTGTWKGNSTVYPDGHTITLSLDKDYNRDTYFQDLLPGYPRYDPNDQYWDYRGYPAYIEGNANMMAFSFAPKSPRNRNKLEGYAGIMRYPTQDSLIIEYVRHGTDQPHRRHYFWGKRVR